MTTIGIRELKTKTSKVLREVSLERKEFIVTNHGRPCGKLVPVDKDLLIGKNMSKNLRGSYSKLPELDEKDFHKLKQVWKSNP